MSDRLFLYIDILGFGDIASDNAAIEAIFERVDALNVHNDTSFKVVAFSDTILVYADGYWLENIARGVMWLVEFAEDLFFRLIGIDRHFRAYISRGGFDDREMKNIRAFYGTALVSSYKKESDISAMGIFITKELAPYSDIYETVPFDMDCNFVFVVRNIKLMEYDRANYPLDPILIEDIEFLVAYEIVYLRQIVVNMRDTVLPSKVRSKYALTWSIYRDRYPNVADTLLANDFEPSAVARLRTH